MNFVKIISLLLVIIDRQRQMIRVLSQMFEGAVIKSEKLEQLVEALGEDNRYYAGHELGHHPSDKEAIDHYLEHGGPEYYRKLHARRESRRLIAAEKALAEASKEPSHQVAA